MRLSLKNGGEEKNNGFQKIEKGLSNFFFPQGKKMRNLLTRISL